MAAIRDPACNLHRLPPASHHTMLTLGIDPDSKDMAFAVWDESGPRDAYVAHVVGAASDYQMLDVLRDIIERTHTRAALWTPDLIVIEGQQVDTRRTGKGDLFKLAHITGAVAMCCRLLYPGVPLLVPTPYEWKRQQRKHAMQARLYDELGWGYQIRGSIPKRTAYSVPANPPEQFKHITCTAWKHVGDALLLARWAQTQGT